MKIKQIESPTAFLPVEQNKVAVKFYSL